MRGGMQAFLQAGMQMGRVWARPQQCRAWPASCSLVVSSTAGLLLGAHRGWLQPVDGCAQQARRAVDEARDGRGSAVLWLQLGNRPLGSCMYNAREQVVTSKAAAGLVPALPLLLTAFCSTWPAVFPLMLGGHMSTQSKEQSSWLTMVRTHP